MSTRTQALRHRNFRLFLATQFVSLQGTWMQTVATSWLVYRLTHSGVLLGLLQVCVYLPSLLLGPVASLVVDRFPKRRLLVITQTLAMLQSLALAVLVLTGLISTASILALATVLGVLNAFDLPAQQALIVELVEKEDVTNAVALYTINFNVARVVGPSIAGFVVARLGEGVCFAANAASFLAFILSLVLMRLPEGAAPAPRSRWQQLAEGVAYVRAHRPVRALVWMAAAGSLANSAIFVLTPLFGDGEFHRGSRGFSFLVAAFGTGAALGALGLARAAAAALPGLLFRNTLLMGVSVALFACVRSFWLSLPLMGLTGFWYMRRVVASSSLLQGGVPDALRGRVSVLNSMVMIGLLPVGSLLAGTASRALGARLTMGLNAALCLLAAILFMSEVTPLRRWIATARGEAAP